MTVLIIPLGLLALISLSLTLWQWSEARRFPLHKRTSVAEKLPGVTLLKPLKGCDGETAACLRSWLQQDYPAPIQILFGVAEPDDPVCEVVRGLVADHPDRQAQLVFCPESLGPNAKVSTLAQLEGLAAQEWVVISDADVRVPPDFLAQLLAGFTDPQVGLVNPFYRLANPSTAAMQAEALAVNADFWSSVLQARRLQPLHFALGAVMALPRQKLAEIGGFKALLNYLADDYELGHRVAASGGRIELCPVVVDCWEAPQGWSAVWRHQLRWARTIRVCQPAAYAASIVSNPILWPALLLAIWPNQLTLGVLLAATAARMLAAHDNQRRLTESSRHVRWLWLTPLKDLAQAALWLGAHLGSTVEWRGRRFRVSRGGCLKPLV